MSEILSNLIQNTEKGIVLNIKLTPNSSKNEIVGYNDDYLKIRISAPPNENKANKKLVEFISDWLKVPKSNISIISGDKSRIKKLLLKNIQEIDLTQKIYLHAKIET